jgi:hypothetical protein
MSGGDVPSCTDSLVGWVWVEVAEYTKFCDGIHKRFCGVLFSNGFLMGGFRCAGHGSSINSETIETTSDEEKLWG